MEEETLHLVAAGNTSNPCLVLLRRKGYSIRVESKDASEGLLWFADCPGRSFLAYTPQELLRLVTMGEYFGHDWRGDMEDVLSEVLRPKPAE